MVPEEASGGKPCRSPLPYIWHLWHKQPRKRRTGDPGPLRKAVTVALLPGGHWSSAMMSRVGTSLETGGDQRVRGSRGHVALSSCLDSNT